MPLINWPRVIVGILIVSAIAFVTWRVSLSFSQGEELEHRQAEIDRLNDARVRDTRIAVAIDTFRGQQFDFAKAFRDALAAQPLTHEVHPHVDPKTGQCEPVRVRDPVRYGILFNAAVNGDAAGLPAEVPR